MYHHCHCLNRLDVYMALIMCEMPSHLLDPFPYIGIMSVCAKPEAGGMHCIPCEGGIPAVSSDKLQEVRISLYVGMDHAEAVT